MTANGRQSIGRPVSLSGTGIHSGETVQVTLRPGPAGQGVVFRRTDQAAAPVPGTVDQVSATDRRTVLGQGSSTISTTEHLLAAVAALGIDDLVIELTGGELPALDGSAAPYYQALRDAGVVPGDGAPERYRPRAPFVVNEGESRYLVAPLDRLRLTVSIASTHPAIGRQSGSFEVTAESFERELARARTYGLVGEVDALRQRGLARGADPSNTIALSDAAVVNGKLHWPDEFVRHKAADLLGDLALVGGRVEADIVAFQPGHQGNVALARALRQAGRGGTAGTVMGIQEILGALPHRYPMLLVDRIVEVTGNERIVGIKNVTMNEPFFQGHFPGQPIMPGVLIVEAMAQVGGMLMMGKVNRAANQIVYFMAIDNVKFRRPVVPGDQIRFEVEMVQVRGKTCRMRGVGLVDGQVAAEAEMLARIVDQ